MNITFISSMSRYAWGGSEELWSRAAISLKKKGHNIGACIEYWDEERPRVQKMLNVGIEIHERKLVSIPIQKRLIRRVIGDPVREIVFENIKKWLIDQEPDLVCISQGSYGDGVAYMELCKKLTFPYLVISQSNSEHDWPDDQLSERIRNGYNKAKKACFVSHANQHLLEKKIADNLHNSIVVRNPFDVHFNIPHTWPFFDEGPKLACVGRLYPPHKGQDILFDVLSFTKWKERNLKVNLYGAGPSEVALKKLSKMLGIEHLVVFMGNVANIESIWETNHCLVLPSRSEGLPLSLVEAMLCHRPAIVTDVAGNAEILEDNQSGFLAESPTVKHLDEAMERAWQNKVQWEHMGLYAGKKIRQLVPEDPAQDFADLILETIDN